MTTLRTRGLLFDMDGVLVDSSGPVRRCWTRWLEMRGLSADKVEKVAHGRRAIDTIRVLGPHLHADAELKVMEELECTDLDGLTTYPGVVDLIRQLPPASWTVVTSATPKLARVRLQHAGVPLPAAMITADKVERGKPDPEPYRKGAELLGLTPGECVVVEDAPAGIQSAKAAGCRVLAVETTHSGEELTGADWIVPRLTEVREVKRRSDGELELVLS